MSIPRDIQCSTRIYALESNEPATAICQAALRVDADVVCIGHRGRTKLETALLGSVATGVLTRAEMPVLLAKGERGVTASPMLFRRARCAGLALALAAYVSAGSACGHAAAPASAQASRPASSKPRQVVPPPAKPPASAAIGDVMADHFKITSWARDAVTAGVIEPLREPLYLLADYRYDDVKLGGWTARIAELQTTARLTADAENLDAAAMGVATMARICGECHRENGVHPETAATPPPLVRSQQGALPDRMMQHVWASTLLWEGLVAPSDALWEGGVRALEAASSGELDRELPSEFAADLREVSVLAARANEATTLEQRADVYGLVLATCAGCHDRWIDHGL